MLRMGLRVIGALETSKAFKRSIDDVEWHELWSLDGPTLRFENRSYHTNEERIAVNQSPFSVFLASCLPHGALESIAPSSL